jgi:hypothetical protein
MVSKKVIMNGKMVINGMDLVKLEWYSKCKVHIRNTALFLYATGRRW